MRIRCTNSEPDSLTIFWVWTRNFKGLNLKTFLFRDMASPEDSWSRATMWAERESTSSSERTPQLEVNGRARAPKVVDGTRHVTTMWCVTNHTWCDAMQVHTWGKSALLSHAQTRSPFVLFIVLFIILFNWNSDPQEGSVGQNAIAQHAPRVQMRKRPAPALAPSFSPAPISTLPTSPPPVRGGATLERILS